MKKILMFLLLGMFLLSFANAETKTYEVNTEINLKVICINDGYCSNESVCNINIINPNESLLVDGQNMTNQISFHNYTMTPEDIGEYKVGGFCKDGTLSQEIDFYFLVSQDGNQVDTGESMMYIWILIFLIIILAGGVFVSIITPYDNISETSKHKKIVSRVTKTKYVKIIAMWFSYGIFALIITVMSGMTNNYIQFEPMKGIFTSMYLFFNFLGYGVSLTSVVVIIWSIWKDIILNKTILREGRAVLSMK